MTEDLRTTSPKKFQVKLVQRQEITEFIEKHHYSHNINGCISDYCFGLYFKDNLIGAAFFGRLAMANQWKRFSDNPDDVIELRRLVLLDEAPRNSESYFIAKMLKYLKKNTHIRIIVSYADAQYGHQGTIYKATHFKYDGFRKGAKVIEYDGKLYHDKAIRTKYKGKLKPFAQRLKEALDTGKAKYVQTAGKHCYTYKLKP